VLSGSLGGRRSNPQPRPYLQQECLSSAFARHKKTLKKTLQRRTEASILNPFSMVYPSII